MKVLHFLFSFFPDPVGGTEVYALGLAADLVQEGVESVITAAGHVRRDYTHEGTRVRRIAVFGHEDESAAAEFAEILDQEKPAIVHFHAFPRIGLLLVREAKARSIPVVYTYHTPSVTCQRNSMMHWGVHPCDGVMRLRRCSRCTLHRLGFNPVSAWAVGSIPSSISSLVAAFGAWLQRRGIGGRSARFLKKADRLALRQASVKAMLADVDHVVAVSEWVRQVLLRNGVPNEKLTLCRHGISDTGKALRPGVLESHSAPLKVAFFGRLDRMKGLEFLVQVIRLDPSLSLKLDIFGVLQGKDEELLDRELRELSKDEPRVAFHPPVPPRDVVPILRSYDVLAVPSQWMETGPLVVLEAFAAGIPVIGSRLGGIAELVVDEQNGLLLEPGDLAAWHAALKRLCLDRTILCRLRLGIKQPRTMRVVAAEMSKVYERVSPLKPERHL